MLESGPVDLMIEQWSRERPELDASSLGVMARITRLARAIDEDATRLLAEYGVSEVEFQLLAAVRTAAPDYQPSPRELLEPLMVSSGGLTSRIDRLEEAGFVERVRNPEDRRGIFVQLTDRGRELVDTITTSYLANQNTVLDRALSRSEQQSLAGLLRKLLGSMRQEAAENEIASGSGERSAQRTSGAGRD